MAMINRGPQEMLNICGPAEPGVAGVCGEDWGEKAICCQTETARKRTPPNTQK